MKLSRLFQLVIGLGLAAGCLYMFFRGVNIDELGQELKDSSPISIIFAAVLVIFSLWLRAIRWAIVLPDADNAHKKNLFAITNIGFMANNILPARMGEAARALILWRKNGFTPFVCIGSLILERIFDVLVFASFFFLPVFLLEGLEKLRYPAYLLLVIYMASILGLVLYALIPDKMRFMGGKTIDILPEKLSSKFKKISQELASNLSWLFSFPKVIAVIFLSYAMIICFAFAMMLIIGGNTPFTFLHALLSQAFASLGAAIPLVPGYIGTLHTALQKGFEFCGLSEEKARAAAILYHATTYISITAVGLFYFFRTDISLKDISNAKENLEK